MNLFREKGGSQREIYLHQNRKYIIEGNPVLDYIKAMLLALWHFVKIGFAPKRTIFDPLYLYLLITSIILINISHLICRENER